MKKEDFERLYSMMCSIEKKLGDYSRLTQRLLTADSDSVDFDKALSDRQTLIEMLTAENSSLMGIVSEIGGEDEVLIRRMLNGETIIRTLSPEQRQLQEKSIDLRALKVSILSLDESIMNALRNKSNEVRDRLSDLNDDKKKIDFYSKIMKRNTGSSFDGNC